MFNSESNSNLGSLETTYFGLLSPNTIYTVDIDWTKNKKILIIFLNNTNSRPEHSEILSVDKSGNVSTIYTTWGPPMYPGYAQISVTDSGFNIKQLASNSIKLYIAYIS